MPARQHLVRARNDACAVRRGQPARRRRLLVCAECSRWFAIDGIEGLQASLHLAATGAFALLGLPPLKRWRPAGRGPFAGDRRIRAWVAPLDEFSFPSGHTLHATAFSVVAVAHYPVLAWLLAPFALAVAASRVVLGLHYPSDVLAAIAIGGLLAAASLWLVPGASLFA